MAARKLASKFSESHRIFVRKHPGERTNVLRANESNFKKDVSVKVSYFFHQYRNKTEQFLRELYLS